MPKCGNNCHTQQGQLNLIETTIVLGTHYMIEKKYIIQQLKVFLSSRTYLLRNYIIRTVWTANDAVFQDMMPRHHFYMF